MNEFVKRFGEDKAKFKVFVKDLCKYNNGLEVVLIAAAKLIRDEFMGKPINKVFINKLSKIIGEDIATFDIETSDYSGEKFIRIRLKADSIKYAIECASTLMTCITFYHGSENTKAAATNDNRFNEGSVEKIINTINTNRVRVARYEDGVKHLAEYIKKYEKAVNLYVRTMESINPIFADTNTAQTMSYVHNNIENIKLWEWDDNFKQKVNPYILD